jgi:hypothetical protein
LPADGPVIGQRRPTGNEEPRMFCIQRGGVAARV